MRKKSIILRYIPDTPGAGFYIGYVALVDIKEPDLAKGKALDIAEGSPTIGSDVKSSGAKEYNVLEGAEIIINTAGVPRTTRPDGTIPTREELLATNLKITDAVSEGIQKYCPKAIIISVANPLDAIVYRLYQNLNPPKQKLMGMAATITATVNWATFLNLFMEWFGRAGLRPE